MNVAEIVTSKIITHLEAGTIPWRKPWRGVNAPRNGATDRPYTGINALLTGCSGYSSPYWFTYDKAQELGGQVREKEKHTPIIFFAKIKKTDGDEFSMLRYYRAFNADQIDGLAEKFHTTSETITPFTPIESAENMISRSTMTGVKVLHDQARAFYSPSLDYINMPKKESFASPGEYYSTLFHEYTHATGHESRLKRELKGFHQSRTEYSREELIAEIGAAILCAESGIENTIQNSASYCQSWLKFLQTDSQAVITAASRAEKAVNYFKGVSES